jgi:TatD DNase family protein
VSKVRGGRDGVPPPTPEPLRVPVADAHCHLDLMGGDVALAVEAARSVGVDRLVTIGIDATTSRLCSEIADEFPAIVAAVAVHPNHASESTAEVLDEIARLATLPRVRAVGETGLDFYRDSADVEDQQRSFRAHIQIAKDAGKALVIHDRDAHDAVLAALEEEGPPDSVVFHCFSGDVEMARTCAERGYAMSFAGNITFKNAQGLRDAVEVAPLELLLVETDAPFLTPMPHRGAPNAPYLIPLTVRTMAQVKGIDEDELCAAMSANADRIFGPW